MNDKKDSEAPIFLECKDHLVSGEKFQLLQKPGQVLKTNPVPADLWEYYRSKNYISHTDDNRSLLNWLYQLIKKYMLRKKLDWIAEYRTGNTLLDVGAGTGDFLIEARRRGWKVAGIEPSAEARSLAAQKDLRLKVDLKEFSGNCFEVISLWHVLEHLSNPKGQVKEIHQLLSSNGLLVVAVPNYKSKDAEFYKEYWAAFDVPRHLWHFSQKALKRVVEPAGFRLLRTRPLLFDAYYVSLLSERNRSGSMRFMQALIRGWQSNRCAKRTSEYSSLVYFFEKT